MTLRDDREQDRRSQPSPAPRRGSRLLRRIAVFAMLPGILALPLHAQNDWFPAAAREGLTRDIASKLAAIDTEDRLSSEKEFAGATMVVNGVSAKVESMGRDALIQLAPRFPGLELPTSGNQALDAIAAFQVCSLPMNAIYADDTPREHRFDMRTWALFSAASIYIASGYLRPAYRAAGVSDEDAEAFLTGEAMTALKTRIGTSQQLLAQTKAHCATPITTLMQ